MDSSAPVHVTPGQRDALDELERMSFRRDRGWVPQRAISRPAELGDLVKLGLVELGHPPADDEQPETCYRRVQGLPFIVILPWEAER